ncbi:fibroin heavy chain isoform X1 [Labrus bergylta]|uniref:fibroin heavy chain isoform X1 n=1 Tax=Labrus bergylta TaxID=56723 RepID=UPI0033134008
MLGHTLLQTSLVLWLAQQTLQGGVKPQPQTVSWGRVLPVRGVGVGVKPGVAGALGALGSRYGSKAMKTGLGRYSGAQLGAGGYRSLGLGGRAGLRQGGYGTPGAYGANLGAGMPLGAGLTNGLGLGLGQGGKRVYGAGLGTHPGYGPLAGIAYPGARPGAGLGYHTGHKAKEQKPGVSTADLGGPEMANLGQAVQDLKREKSSHLYGQRDTTVGLETPSMGRGNILGPTALDTGFRQVKSLDPMVKSSSLRPLTPLDKQRKVLAQGGESYDPMLLERRRSANHGATLAARSVRQQLPLVQANIRTQGSPQVQHTGEYDSLIHPNQRRPNCGPTRDLSGVLEIKRHELLGSERQRTPSLFPRIHADKDSKHLGHTIQQAQGEINYGLPLPQIQDVRSGIYSLSHGQATGSHLSAVADGQAVKDLGPSQKTKGPRIHGSIAVENLSPGSVNLQVQGARNQGPVSGSETQSLGITSIERQEGEGVTVDGQEQIPFSHTDHDVAKSKALSIPGQTGRRNQATSYMGGAGNYGGHGGYGAGLGQGAYLGATGKLGSAAALGQGGYPHGAAGISPGYGEGVTGYLGAMAGNGYGGDAAKAMSAGYGNGYSDGYGAGLGYPAELTDGAGHKARKSEALGTGGYAGQVQGAYGALGAGLESPGGKYVGGAAQVPYANAPVIPTGLEADAGYPYPAQQLALGAEGAKTANKFGAGAGFGAQQTGYRAQLGATQDALGDQTGKYGGVDGALGNGYKG